jgi:hypothetical protein
MRVCECVCVVCGGVCGVCAVVCAMLCVVALALLLLFYRKESQPSILYLICSSIICYIHDSSTIILIIIASAVFSAFFRFSNRIISCTVAYTRYEKNKCTITQEH